MEIRVGDRVAEIELISKDGNKVEVMLDNERFEVDVVMAERGACSVLHEGKSYSVELTKTCEARKYRANTAYFSYEVEIIDAQAKYLQLKNKGTEKQDNILTALMPGKIVKIPVVEKQVVDSGDIVVVVEAMKMQSNYKVSEACVVDRILVKEGDTVVQGQPLVLLENRNNQKND